MMRPGYIYILINPALHRDLLKIGKTTRKPEDRAKEISSTGVPAEYRVAFDIESSDCDFAETIVHSKLAEYRYTKNREFFKLPLKAAIAEVSSIVTEIENTPLDERGRFSTGKQKASPKSPHKFSETKNHIPDIDSKYIKKTTDSLFRVNEMDLDGSEVFYSIKNLWKGENSTKNALVYYSKRSKNLVVILKGIVSKYLFNPLFEKSDQGYVFKKKYQNLEYKQNRVNIKFQIENDYLLLSIKPLKKYGLTPLKILKLPVEYWPKVIPENRSVTEEIIYLIRRMCEMPDPGRGIKVCHDLNE